MKHFSLISLLMMCIAIMTGCAGVSGGGINQNGGTGGSGGGTGDITSVNHIIIMFQENRSFDAYFGQMTAYRQKNGIPINSSDGKINDLSAAPGFSNTVAGVGAIAPYHTGSVCTEDLTSDWAESHKEMNLTNPAAASPSSPMDGFAQTAHDISAYALQFGITLADQTGKRAMGYFNDSDLNYYYFMASNFAMGDAFYSPQPSRTAPNRLFIHAATSQGHVHDPTTQLTATTIWQELDAAGVTWKIYITDPSPNPSVPPPGFTYLSDFTYYNQASTKSHIVPLTQYFTDVTNGTLPSVAFIETGQFSGRDEHPSNFNPAAPTSPDHVNVQTGAAYVANIINSLMNSPSWKDSVFFWTMDEGGGTFDHVPPISVMNPDGITPIDYKADGTDPHGDFTITGFRIPNFIVSPFAKKNFVSHTPMDYTAYLTFIEKRFNLSPLTRRDGQMPDMTEFFDFTNGGPWATPPSPPAQRTDGVCDFTKE
jgi:phospholipase C